MVEKSIKEFLNPDRMLFVSTIDELLGGTLDPAYYLFDSAYSARQRSQFLLVSSVNIIPQCKQLGLPAWAGDHRLAC